MSTPEQEVSEAQDIEEPRESVQAEVDVRAERDQRRIDDEFKAAARDRAQIQQTAVKLLEAAQRFEEQAKPRQEAADDKPPARDDFDSYELYLKAELEHQKKDIERRVDTAVDRAISLREEWQEKGSIAAKMGESARRGEEAYPGFADIIERVPAMPQAALSAWQELEEPEHVAHYFGTHPEEAKKISRMTPARAAHAVIALGDRLDQERAIAKNGKGEVPEFGPKPGGKTAPSGELRGDMTAEQYEKARIAQKLAAMGVKR